MNRGTLLGLCLLILGTLIMIGYSIYLGFEELIASLDLFTGLISGLIIAGLLILFISVFFEQHKDKKEFTKKIRKEDLEP